MEPENVYRVEIKYRDAAEPVYADTRQEAEEIAKENFFTEHPGIPRSRVEFDAFCISTYAAYGEDCNV